MSRAGLNRLASHATPVLLLAANAPDCDLITRLGGSLTYLQYHRHITHAIIAAPLIALLPLLIVRAFARKPFEWRRNYALSLVAVLTHLALDFTNIYGIRLALPFSSTWFRLDLISVIDPWVWTVLLLLTVALPGIAGLVSSEIGERRRTGHGRLPAALALVFLVVYAGGRAILHARAVDVLESYVYDGSPPRRVAAFPTIVNPLRWRALVETSSSYWIYDLDLQRTFDPTAGSVFYKPETTPQLEAVFAHPVFRAFVEFAQYPMASITPVSEPAGAVSVSLMDMRFGRPGQTGFAATAVVTEQLQVVDASFAFGVGVPR